MNIMKKLTMRSLKENKRRTIVTIIGVIISVAMITAVATLAVSFLDLMKRDHISQNGEWHVIYKNLNQEQLQAIKKDEETEKLILSKDLGYAYFEESQNKNKPYFFIKEYDKNGFETYPVVLKEGRFPKSDDEIIISEEILNNENVDLSIGSELPLEIGNRYVEGMDYIFHQHDPLQRDEEGIEETLQIETSKTYTVVGVIERPNWEQMWAPGYTVISYIDEKNVSDEYKVNGAVKVKNIDGNLFEHAEQLANENDIVMYDFNSPLLRYYGVTGNDNLRMTLYSLAGIIIGIIIIGSIALIYNAFGISVSERSRQFGMLSSVGATKKQKRNAVFFEGVIIGCISIPLGIVAGLLGIGVTFFFINSFLESALNTTETLRVVVTPATIIVSCVTSMLTIFLSTYLPARRASKVSAIDAIRQTQDVKLTKKAVKTSKLIGKLFGIEGEIALKNLKRNRKKYVTTIFSLVTSIVLFLTVSYFTENLKKSVEMSQEEINFDIEVMAGEHFNVKDFEPFMYVEHVTEATIIENVYLDTWVEVENIAKELHEVVKSDQSILQDGKYPYHVNIYGLDNDSYQAYANKIGLDLNEFNNEAPLKGIVIDKITYQDGTTGKYVETKPLEVEIGDTIDLFYTNFETNEQTLISTVEIVSLTEELPMGVRSSWIGGFDLIVSKETIDALLEEHPMPRYPYLYINSSNPIATQKALEEMQQADMHVYNVYQNRQQAEQLIILLSIFTYGFIILISLISIANIFNTISTSIALRKREFAMLKSVGMTEKSFNKMVVYESGFYGLKALLYGLPISFLVMVLLYRSLRYTFEYGFVIPWTSIIIAIVAIFLIVSSSMLYSIRKIKDENIIEGLKQENI